MQILDLPLELLQEIIFRSIQARGLRRGIRLRLVNISPEAFAREVLESIFAYRLLDSYFASVPKKTIAPIPLYIVASLERCVLAESVGINTAFAWVRTVAEHLCRKDSHGRDMEAYVKELCPLMVEEHGQHIAQLWHEDSGHDISYLDTHTYVAAVMTNTTPVIKAWLASGKPPDVESLYFGFTRTYVERHGDCSLLAAMMTYPCKDQSSQQKSRLYVFAGAVEAGRINATRFAFDFNATDYPWHFSRAKTRRRRDRPNAMYYSRENEEKLTTLHTPSKEVFDFIMEKRQLYCIDRQFGPEQWTFFLHHCASKGWEEMASVYLKLGASVDGRCEAGFETKTRPLIEACTYGHLRIVELFLERGAETSAPALEIAAEKGHTEIVHSLLKYGAEIGEAVSKAAAKGYRDIVQALLNHGAAIPDGSRLLEHAIEHEDKVMFRLFLKSCNASALAEGVAYAEARGLESMLDLLATT